MVLGPPKSRAGVRVVSLRGFVQTELRRHLDEFVGTEAVSLVVVGLTGPTGAPIRRGNFNDLVKWSQAVTWGFAVERVRGIEPPLSAWENAWRRTWPNAFGRFRRSAR